MPPKTYPRVVARDEIERKVALVGRLFSSPDGEKVLELLNLEFNADQLLVPGQSDTTAYNLGRRDVVVYLFQMMRLFRKGATPDERTE